MANQPTETLCDGPLKASIWKNEGANGIFYNLTHSRIFQDEAGKYHDSNSFSGPEVLRVGHLATRAYDRVSELYQELKQSASQTKQGPARWLGLDCDSCSNYLGSYSI